jgi:N-methylhydantoinase A/oxoprolinase/acetone carboxylase beta subunit
MIRIGIDIGGTFTDVVAAGGGQVRITKVPSTRADPSAAVRKVLDEVLPEWNVPFGDVARFVHGTTVATNAVLERRGARVGLLATDGFTDVLEIGRQNRHQVYDLILKPETPGFLAPGALRRGVVEAVEPDGQVRIPLDEESLRRSVESLAAEGVEAIAVCFLYSHVNPIHERMAAEYIRGRYPDIIVSLSCDIDPAFREYERTVVTCFDAYIKGGLDRYLANMEADLARVGIPASLQIMQSRGGVCGAKVARQRPIRLFLSGPAAGVVGACEVGRSVGCENVITVDIGGTSSDIALIAQGQAMVRSEGWLDGYRIRVPMVDVNSIGAGGGSIAWIDVGGGLRVGPQSAGAQPGPACYGRGGTQATVTDASVVLGLLDPGYFAGGSLQLDPALAADAVRSCVAEPLGMSLHEAALGIHRVVNAQMAEGIRLVSISRGVDPREFALMPFGGAGGLHAAALVRELDMRTIVVPRAPGVLCAAGLLSAMTEHEASAAFLSKFADTDPSEILAVCDRLAGDCARLMAIEGISPEQVQTQCYADVCYMGQSHYLEVPIAVDDPEHLIDRAYESFCGLHAQVYGHSTRSPARFVNLRVVQRSDNQAAGDQSGTPRSEPGAAKGVRQVLFEGQPGFVPAQIFQRDSLVPGQLVAGPAIIEQADTTTPIEPGWQARVTDNGVLILRRQA